VPSSKPKPYKYHIRPAAPPENNYGQTVSRTGDQEQLTGQINGMKASDLEERSYRSISKLEISTEFRVRITSEALGDQRLTHKFANVRGEVEIDFLCDHNGRTTPIFVDGSISHFFTPAQAEADKLKTELTDTFGKQFGWREAIRVPFWKLIDQEMSDRTYRDIFL
jgi:hypothetical protein